MSITNPVEIDYPESDGRPMGETDTHRKWIVRIDQLLIQRLKGEQHYIGSDLLIYYERGQPRRFVVPDNFVVLDCDPGPRRTFKTWDEQRTPDVVFEVTSRSTKREDLVFKPKIYEQFGVSEYFLYDPLAEYLSPALQGFRLQNKTLVQMESMTGELTCQTLGIQLRLSEKSLEMVDLASGELLLTEAEDNARRADQFRESADQYRQDAERQRQFSAQQQELVEQQQQLAANEREARQIAEAKNRQLEEELRRLRG